MRSHYEIRVQPAENGFVVDVGCMHLVFTPQEFLVEMTRWVENPQKIEGEYLKKYREEPSPPSSFLGSEDIGRVAQPEPPRDQPEPPRDQYASNTQAYTEPPMPVGVVSAGLAPRNRLRR